MTQTRISGLTPKGSKWYHRENGGAVRVTATRRGPLDKSQIWVHFCADRHYRPGAKGYSQSLLADFLAEYRAA